MTDKKLHLYNGRVAKGSAVFLLIIAAMIFAGCGGSDYSLRYVQDSVQLKSGDLVFRTGESINSKVVTTVDNNNYSHVGIVVYCDDGWYVLHAVPNERSEKGESDSVKLEPVEVFFRTDRAINGAVYRMNLSDADTSKIIDKCLDIYNRRLLFDDDFNTNDSSAFYCTELACFVYDKVLSEDLSEGRRHNLPMFPDLIFCSDITHNPKLKKVYCF